jgi:hypothetical protein
MSLVAEKDHFVFRQGGLYRGDGRGGQVAREPNIVNFRADTAGKRATIEIDGDGDGLRCLMFGHGKAAFSRDNSNRIGGG